MLYLRSQPWTGTQVIYLVIKRRIELRQSHKDKTFPMELYLLYLLSQEEERNLVFWP